MKAKELDIKELQHINGGSFGYDIGWLLHYAWDTATGTAADQAADITTWLIHYAQ